MTGEQMEASTRQAPLRASPLARLSIRLALLAPVAYMAATAVLGSMAEASGNAKTESWAYVLLTVFSACVLGGAVTGIAALVQICRGREPLAGEDSAVWAVWISGLWGVLLTGVLAMRGSAR